MHTLLQMQQLRKIKSKMKYTEDTIQSFKSKGVYSGNIELRLHMTLLCNEFKETICLLIIYPHSKSINFV